jgi:hypothetical protein
MTSWSIQIDGVRAVLASVAVDGEAVVAAGAAWRAAAGSARAGVTAPVVAAALRRAVEDREDVPDRIAAAVHRAVEGASAATTAYLDGDEEMAATATAAASVADSWRLTAPPSGVDRGLWRAQ